MRILYVAAGIPVPGTVGGSTHVVEVSRGLAALGHQLLVIAGPGRGDHGSAVGGDGPASTGATEVINSRLPKGLAVGLYPLLARRAGEFAPDVVLERYYNFAGIGLAYARWRRLPAVLEVNAPVYDPPGTLKDRLDRLAKRPLRRWAAWQVAAADRIVTPLAATVGRYARSEQIVELPWGANTALFDPARHGSEVRSAQRRRLGIEPSALVIVFAGSFRAWHGADLFIDALRALLPVRHDVHALLIGDGPERAALEAVVNSWGDERRRVTFTGAVQYADVPGLLATADIAVAPFAPWRHPALSHFGFYWSPLKVFEYGAMALPIVCPRLPPLDAIVRDGREGRLYDLGDAAAFRRALEDLIDNPRRAEFGRAARERVLEHFSWDRHCRALDETLRSLIR